MPRKSRVTLTAKLVERARPPKTGVTEIWDAALPGFGIRIFAKTGVKSWCLMGRLSDGKRLKQRRWTLGRFPRLSLAEARAKAAEWKDQIADGVDPNPKDHPTATSSASAVTTDKTFGNVAETYIKRECGKLKRGWEIERIIRRELLPKWENLPIGALRKRDAIELTDTLEDAGKPMAAHRLHEVIKRIGNWAVDRDEIEVSPFANWRAPVEKKSRDRVLTDVEIVDLWPTWEEMAWPFGRIMQLLLLTGQRRSEVAGMRWRELDLDAAQWVIPAERTKSDRSHMVPLSPLAVGIIRALPQIDDEYVFATRRGANPASGFSRAHTRAIETSGVNGWRLHDLRRTFRTGLALLGTPEIVAERSLNHAPRGLIGVYNQHQYAEERRRALDTWARKIESLVNPDDGGKIVEIKGGRMMGVEPLPRQPRPGGNVS